MPAARGLVDLWPRGRVRTPWRRRRWRVPLRIHHKSRWRHHQYLLRSCGLLNRPGSLRRALSSGLARCPWKLRTPESSGGFMKPLLQMFEFAFGFHHRERTAVFTIKKRTYQVCLNCGQEFEYSLGLILAVGLI